MKSIPFDVILSASPKAVERAQRVQFAAQLLENGRPEREVRERVRSLYNVSRVTAWRTVEIATDLVL